MVGQTAPDMHPYRRRKREHILEFQEEMLAEPEEGKVNYLCSAEVGYLGDALDCLCLELDDLACKFVVRARLSIDEAFRRGVEPYIGINPRRGFYCDDDELNHHWAIAYKTRYKIDLLRRGKGDRDDLLHGMQHLEKLWGYTDGLTDHMAVAKVHILCDYLWLGIAAEDPGQAIERASRHVKIPISPRTRIKGFLQEHSYLRFALLVARFVNGEATLREAARRSFVSLFEIHADVENEIYRTCRSGSLFAFEWAWLWECAFERVPSVEHAIDILKGTVDLNA